jgi:acyl-CoA synthetase (AMP-forming)/AMP-acid ligase II
MSDTLRGLIEKQARERPDAPALQEPGRDPLSYAQLLARVDCTVGALRQFGICRGDRVAVVLPNGAETAAAFLSIVAGATCAPLNPGYRLEEYGFHLSDLNAKALVLPRGVESLARRCALQRGIPILELPVEQASARAANGFSQPDDIALILHTSGTTSRPKIVPLTQANLCASAFHIQIALQLTPADRCLNVMPRGLKDPICCWDTAWAHTSPWKWRRNFRSAETRSAFSGLSAPKGPHRSREPRSTIFNTTGRT